MSRSETAVISNDDDKVENEFNEDESRAEFATEDLSSVEVSGKNEMKMSNKNITYAIKDFQDVAIQVESDFLTPKLLSFIKNDQQLSTLTGLSNFNLLNTIEKLVIQVQSTYNMSHSSIKFDLRELIVMTFIKLKQNMSYATLAIFFNFSKQSCKEQIWKMIDVLYMALKPSIYWPT